MAYIKNVKGGLYPYNGGYGFMEGARLFWHVQNSFSYIRYEVELLQVVRLNFLDLEPKNSLNHVVFSDTRGKRRL